MEDPVDGAEAFMDIGQRTPHGLAVAGVRDERQHVGAVRTQPLDRRQAVRLVRRTVPCETGSTGASGVSGVRSDEREPDRDVRGVCSAMLSARPPRPPVMT